MNARNFAFETTRDRIYAEYAEKLKKDPRDIFGCSTRPYVSVQSIAFDIADALPTGAGNAVMAHAVCKAKQELEWFSFGVNQTIQIGSQGNQIQKKATNADTNLGQAKKTNGVEDFVIEGVSVSVQGMRIVYAEGDLPTLGDDDVEGAYTGLVKIVDPASLVTPPQFGAPLNLEDVFFEAVAAKISAKLVWDQKGYIPIGTLDQFPEGAARSIIRAHGDPNTFNRYKIPEGAAWRRVDKTDGDFSVQGRVEDPVVIPITLVAFEGADTPLVVPTRIYVDIRLRLHGIGFGKPGQNNF